MTPNIEVTMKTADKRLSELLNEYDSCLHNKAVSPEALQLTHDICGLLRSVLDRSARRYWEVHVSPALSDVDRKAATIYFPVAKDLQSLDSILGRWRWKTVRDQHGAVYDYMLGQQAFSNQANAWLPIVDDLAVAGKHIDLSPQTKTEERRITVNGPGGQVSWNPSGVTFGHGVFINGAPVNPTTQRIVPTVGVTERIETWVHFIVGEHNVNAAGLCKQACDGVRRIATEMTTKFGL